MKKSFLIILAAFSGFIINGQNLEKKIKQLIRVDGTISKIENLLSETIDDYKVQYIGVTENFWKGLNNRVKIKSINEFETIIIPIYSKYFNENELDDAISFYQSQEGKNFTKNLLKIEEELTVELFQWSQNLNANIIEEIDNKDNQEVSSEEFERFNKEFKNNHGLQILNLTDFAIDKEHNPGSLLLDFGKVDGTENVTKILKIVNNSSDSVSFNKTLFTDDDIIFDWGNNPIKVGETRDLKIILNADIAENRRYTLINLMPSSGQSISMGVKYDAPQKELKFKTSKTRLNAKPFRNNYSGPYTFTIKNIGKKEFHISDIEIDKPIAYLNYSEEVIESGEEIEIKILVSNDLMKDYKTSQANLKLKVDISRGRINAFSSHSDKTIEFTID